MPALAKGDLKFDDLDMVSCSRITPSVLPAQLRLVDDDRTTVLLIFDLDEPCLGTRCYGSRSFTATHRLFNYPRLLTQRNELSGSALYRLIVGSAGARVVGCKSDDLGRPHPATPTHLVSLGRQDLAPHSSRVKGYPAPFPGRFCRNRSGSVCPLMTQSGRSSLLQPMRREPPSTKKDVYSRQRRK